MSALGLLSLRDVLPTWAVPAWFAALLSLLLAPLLTMALRRRREIRTAGGLSPLPPAQVPSELARFAQPWIGRLGFLGYQVLRIARAEGDDPPDRVTWYLASANERTVAVMTGWQTPDGGRPLFSLRLMTFLADGRVVATADHPVTHRPPGHWSLLQRAFPTIDGQLQAHRTHVAARVAGIEPHLPAGAELAGRIAGEDRAVNDALVASGDYRRGGEDSLRPVLRRVPAMAARDLFARLAGLRAASPRKKDVAAMRRNTAENEEEAAPAEGSFALSLEQLVEQDIRRYRKHADQPPGWKHVLLRLALLGATLFAFTALFGREDPVVTVGMLLGLIAAHELGHWLMMKLFGFRGMGRFFLPFLGPVDRGHKPQAPAWQQLMVILAGPLPGVLAGTGVLVAGFFLPDLPPWLRDLGGLALALNAFHLLPFLPLDGGKVVDLLLFRDLPWLRPLFTAFSALATLIASLLLKSRPLRVVAIGMFGGLIWDIRMIKVVRGGRRLGWAGTVEDENEALQRIFLGIREEKNEDFLRSHDWQRQIDVLLAEVLRKRPGMATRLFGGAFYSGTCLMPILLIVGLFMVIFVGSAGQLARLATDVVEFQEAFPHDQRPLTQNQLDAILAVVATTRETAEEGRAAALEPSLDRLDWTAASIALHAAEIDEDVLSAWLGILCGKLEAATRNGRHAEALRRTEVLLHAIAALEPAPALAERELLWEAELRTLAAVETLAASGKCDAAAIQRLEARVNALNKAPRPAVENLLLVGGWGKKQAEVALVLPQEDGGTGFDARFWRIADPQTLRFSDNIRAFRDSTPATVAVARHWKATGRVGEIPAETEAAVHPAPGEAEFIAAFCESHRRMAWRRLTTLSALRLEAYRLKAGKLPATWQHELPGGASLTLAGSFLKLEDRRDAGRRTLPEWLGAAVSPPHAEHRCPLHGAPPELSRK